MWVELNARAGGGLPQPGPGNHDSCQRCLKGRENSIWNPWGKDRLARLGRLGFLDISSKGLDLGIGSLHWGLYIGSDVLRARVCSLDIDIWRLVEKTMGSGRTVGG